MGSGYFDLALPRVLAHRGLATNVPENTVPAFQAALDAGAGYLETDVRLTRDGVAVLAHDATFVSADGRIGEIAGSDLSDLIGLDLGGAGFVSLADALDAFPRERFNIDVKVDEAVPATVEAIRRAGAIDRVLLASFSEQRRLRLARELPGVATSPGRNGVARVLLAALTPSRRAMRAALAGARALQAPTRVVTGRLVRAVHAAGAEVHAWTVNDPATMRRLLDLGVDGLVTDRCDLAVAVVRERI
ncbi:glycerophosphodiester phosphodiesterase family protein [Agromyces silvae]|uniref:glycerophosphodiester phosphodiesterase family protein n=1 Tax=Agromyces silvae TaxID=3388266 RepID=UPI00280BC189|nr:glycerophosphodiester phosphodiesterase family protein [Agromyces protaetiae]